MCVLFRHFKDSRGKEFDWISAGNSLSLLLPPSPETYSQPPKRAHNPPLGLMPARLCLELCSNSITITMVRRKISAAWALTQKGTSGSSLPVPEVEASALMPLRVTAGPSVQARRGESANTSATSESLQDGSAALVDPWDSEWEGEQGRHGAPSGRQLQSCPWRLHIWSWASCFEEEPSGISMLSSGQAKESHRRLPVPFE